MKHIEAVWVWWSAMIDFPALILLIIFALGLFVLWKTQQKTNFDFADMLRDENGKPSSARLAVFVCLGITTWGFMYILIKRGGEIDPWIFLGYAAIWSGAKIAETFIHAYSGRPTITAAAATTTTVASTTVVETAETKTAEVKTEGKT